MTGEEEKNTEMQVRISARLGVLKNLAREKGDSALVEKIEEELEWLCSLFDSEQAEKDLGWHSVDECLPEIDEEVIALTNQMNGKTLDTARRICYAHRPDPKGWDGRSLDTGEVKHYDVVTYNGWNVPGVRYWMPCPKIPEE